ncbi:uncharacterized protein LOC123922485 [Trifolium pratense]|uniref:uncharacterized protein LOC123922485 n=1 Tax=Trifolium pratense TaxID=57577 RepID=UPI001E69430A|nr:uncharacterized protein LOC123922485 [Trifolium pratense]
MPRREELLVEEEERFPIGRAQDALSDDIGWHFANILQGVNRNTIQCKICDKVITGGITRLKEHIVHFPGEVKGCGRVTQIIRESMMQLLLDNKAKKNDSRKRKEEFVSLLRGDNNVNHEDLEEEEAIRQATHESMRSHNGKTNKDFLEVALAVVVVRGTSFIKSIDASDVTSRNTEYYFNLLDKMVEEVEEEYVVQIVTDIMRQH